ncbi:MULTISPECIES: lipocalin-like domain-containing protein [Burkholderiaceae]|uniref:lipocalin-like domain-containing protein n=1 Tax=Burkholderiaceae TaxID=119060 RepID=UPI00141E4F37|nr:MULTISPECIES: lipocalin-like domain-containing protein [Burkholderiaceae]MBN3845621.1 lipocalin-like domain-containing protein [Paraburkholderia sp. Ac-20342]NIF51059.1 lipocalin-like domain-containing protein [Burkholderia sp. Ax-1724]
MRRQIILKRGIPVAVLSVCLLWTAVARADATAFDPSLVGTWTLVAADVQHPDGSRASDYGAAPKGLLLIDAQGHYSLQIFKAERPQFASGDKGAGTPTEYKAAVMGSSTHFGTISVDQAGGTLTFHIQNASFPNWEGAQQKRSYELKDGKLSYRVTPRPNGDIPISIWQRLN